MRSKKDEVRVPHPIKDRVDKRWKHLGYRSWPCYINGLQLKDILTDEKHYLVKAIANAPWKQQDKLIDALFSLTPDQIAQATIDCLEKMIRP